MSQAESSSLKLRAIEDEDTPQMIRWRNDPAIFKWCRQREPISKYQHWDWDFDRKKDPNIKMYGIEAGELVGVCGLTSIDWINRRAEFSLYVGPEHQGKGYGARALRKLLGVAFNVHNLHLVWGESFAENPATKMFERVGFKFDGLRRDFYFREGKYIHASLWSITSDEFRDMASNRKRGVEPSIVGNPPGPAANSKFDFSFVECDGYTQEAVDASFRKAQRKARRKGK